MPNAQKLYSNINRYDHDSCDENEIDEKQNFITFTLLVYRRSTDENHTENHIKN